ncbi:MAG: AhpC/TSA family protein [Bacteroidales bacterium]|nr:AhpC/TSA family protein [Bacteroidales bacterium]
MKKAFIALTAILALAACGEKNCEVEGTITPTDMTQDAVILVTGGGETVDTLQIVDGKFSYTCPADVTVAKTVRLVTPDKRRNPYQALFIAEAGKIAINLDSAQVVGGKLNAALTDYKAAEEGAYSEYMAKYKELSAALPERGTEEWKAAREKMNEELTPYIDAAKAKVSELSAAAFAANKDNAVGLQILYNKLYDFESAAEFDEFTAEAADFIKQDKRVAKFRETLVARDNTAEGKPFVDFKGQNAAGEEVALSDYVGKGNIVLVDFWASWCGPCRGEIPGLIEVSKQFAGKNFQVVGVAVWDKKEDTDRAIAELGIPYTQIYVGDDKTPTDLYGINGIPQIMLFGADGTILKRELRGAAIPAAIEEALNN